jgi:hypothetical protein
VLRESSASEISVTSGAGGSNTGSALGLGEADVADESDGLGSEEGSEKLRGGELVVVVTTQSQDLPSV